MIAPARRATSSLYACLAVLIGGPAAAADRSGAALDNSAALSSAAVLSTIRSGGAIWYNPAGLGGNTRDKLDVSLSAFVLRDRSAEGAVVGRLSGDLEARSDLDSVELTSVPSALVFSRRLDDAVTVGLGVFVPRMDVQRVSATTPIEAPGIDYVQRADFSRIAQRYAAGPAIGWALSDRLRLGVSLFGIYETESAGARIWSRLRVDGVEAPVISMLTQVDGSITRFGARPVAGVQWTPAEGVHLGLTLRAPAVRFAGLGEGASLVQLAGAELSPISEYDPSAVDDEGFGLMAPGGLHAGVSFPFAAGQLALAVELRHGLDDDELDARFEPVWNVQLGGLWPLGEAVAIGAGLFTDHSPVASADALWQERVDFYGVTGGVRLRDPLELDGGGSLVFETTIGVRYALGIGEVGGLAVDYTDPELFSGVEVGVVHHTAALHVGSALLF